MNHTLRKVLLVFPLSLVLLLASHVGSAQAIQIYGVYAPEDHGSYVTGWANIRTDCPYYKCSVYLKIERSSWSGPRFVNGSFVNWSSPWVTMSATKLAGCYDYRSTLEIYEDSIGPVSGGINLGRVGFNASGQAIYRYKITWSSGWVRRCR